YTTDLILRALTGNPDVWAKTALLVTWDENGGFFDHVPPPTAPAGTPGEYVTAGQLPAAAQDVPGPVRLGFRVPLLAAAAADPGGRAAARLSGPAQPDALSGGGHGAAAQWAGLRAGRGPPRRHPPHGPPAYRDRGAPDPVHVPRHHRGGRTRRTGGGGDRHVRRPPRPDRSPRPGPDRGPAAPPAPLHRRGPQGRPAPGPHQSPGAAPAAPPAH